MRVSIAQESILIVMGKLEIGKVLEVEAGAGIWDKSGMRSLDVEPG